MSTALQGSIARLGQSLDEYKKDAVPVNVALGDLTPYERQSRKTFELSSLEEMAATMKAVGVMTPLLVRPKGSGKYEIIAGERRWRSAKIAELGVVPCLVKDVDDETADKLHLYENIHRENLSNLDLAQRVDSDLKAEKGNLAAVAAKYGKSKSWVSKLVSIAAGGEIMGKLVEEGVTADRAVLATVASMERKAPQQAEALIRELKAAPASANKRAIAEQFAKEVKAPPKAPSKSVTKASQEKISTSLKETANDEPIWRSKGGVTRDLAVAVLVVELSPVSAFTDEFLKLSKKHGNARLANATRHPDSTYAIVEFGDSGLHRRTYRADELRLLSVQ